MITRAVIKLVLLTASALVLSCKNHECPPPKQKYTLYTLSLDNASLPDVQVNSSVPSLNAGTSEKIGASAWTYSGTFGAVRTYINFDLSSIPANAEITSAEITFFADTSNLPGHSQLSGSNSWKIKRITSDWTESTISWNIRPTTDNVNAVSMVATDSVTQNYTADITDIVKDQHANPMLYYGISLQLDTELAYRSIMFCSREHRYAATRRPRMEIKYKVPM